MMAFDLGSGPVTLVVGDTLDQQLMSRHTKWYLCRDCGRNSVP